MAEEEIKKEEKSGLKTIFRVFSAVLIVVTFVVLFYYKRSNPTFSVGWIILIGFFSIILFGTTFFIFEIPRWWKEFRTGKVDNNPIIPNTNIIIKTVVPVPIAILLFKISFFFLFLSS